ncbi:MAG: drug/metabolite transporter (DMT)-like permease [Gammaproteobacteria bacterium]
MNDSFGFAITLVLIAAFLHALWNALIKGAPDRAAMMGLINVGHGILGVGLAIAYLPPAAESWRFLAGSTLIHFFYYGFLLRAYRYGDLSQVYPIARGIAPILVASGGQVFAGEVLPPIAWAGILLVSLGIGIIFISQQGKKTDRRAIIAALLVGFTIAAYSIVDGLGVRLADSPIGYIGWLFMLECISGFALLIWRWDFVKKMRWKSYAVGLVGGLVSASAYGLAIYAKSLTSLGLVSAIRESSVIIAALIGVIYFGERPWKPRILAALVVAMGVILIATTAQQT